MPYVSREEYEHRGRSIFRNAWENITRLFRRSGEDIEDFDYAREANERQNLLLGGVVSEETLAQWRNWQSERETLIWRGHSIERHTTERINRSTIHDDRVARFNQIGNEHPRVVRHCNGILPYRAWDENIFNSNVMPRLQINPITHEVREIRRAREVSLADLEAELNEEIEVGDEVDMPTTYTNSTTGSWVIGSSNVSGSYNTSVYGVAENIEGITRRCGGCHKSLTDTSKLRKLRWGVYLCESCSKEYDYLIKILRKMKGNWNNIHYLYDYAVFLTNRKYKRVKLRDGKSHGCFACGQLKKDVIMYKIEGRHRHIYICRCCEPYIQYMMKSIYSKHLQAKMKRLTIMLKNQDEHIKIKREFEKAKVFK